MADRHLRSPRPTRCSGRPEIRIPDTDGSERQGDNLYTNSILALDAKTGKLRWHYQFTPHDLWDWDAQEPPVLIDAVFQGRPRKLLLQANRNGFFYVLDRVDGKVLLGTAVRAEAHLGQRHRPGRPPAACCPATHPTRTA